jgi:hypothetical protein
MVTISKKSYFNYPVKPYSKRLYKECSPEKGNKNGITTYSSCNPLILLIVAVTP